MSRNPVWREFATQYPEVRYKKVVRTLELCLIRARYFLAAKVDDDLLDSLAKLDGDKLYIHSDKWHSFYHKLYELDAAIRYADDRIDEDLVGRGKIDFGKIDAVIADFVRSCPQAAEVGRLYSGEFKVWQSQGKSPAQKKLDLLSHVRDRMMDLYFLMDQIVKEVGSALNPHDLKTAWKLLRCWEEIDALVTDIRGLREDRLRSSYNVFIFAKRNGVPIQSLVQYIKKNISQMEKYQAILAHHPHADFVTTAVRNTSLLCDNFYLPWIEAYSQSEEKWLKGIGATLI